MLSKKIYFTVLLWQYSMNMQLSARDVLFNDIS